MEKVYKKRYILVFISLITLVYYILREDRTVFEEISLRILFGVVFLIYLYLIFSVSKNKKLIATVIVVSIFTIFTMMYVIFIRMDGLVISEEYSVDNGFFNIYKNLSDSNEGIVDNFHDEEKNYIKDQFDYYAYDEFDTKVLENVIEYHSIDKNKMQYMLQDKIEKFGYIYYIFHTVEEYDNQDKVYATEFGASRGYYGGVKFYIVKVNEQSEIQNTMVIEREGDVFQRISFIEGDTEDICYYGEVYGYIDSVVRSKTVIGSIDAELTKEKQEVLKTADNITLNIKQAKIYNNILYALNLKGYNNTREFIKYDLSGNILDVTNVEEYNHLMGGQYLDFDVMDEQIYTYAVSRYKGQEYGYVYTMHIYDLDFIYKRGLMFYLPTSKEVTSLESLYPLGSKFNVERTSKGYKLYLNTMDFELEASSYNLYLANDYTIISDEYYKSEESYFSERKVHNSLTFTFMIVLFYPMVILSWVYKKYDEVEVNI